MILIIDGRTIEYGLIDSKYPYSPQPVYYLLCCSSFYFFSSMFYIFFVFILIIDGRTIEYSTLILELARHIVWGLGTNKVCDVCEVTVFYTARPLYLYARLLYLYT